MKKGKLLNSELSQIVAAQGHTDTICIGDAGFPVPKGIRCVDLAVSPGIPSFIEVLDAVTSELICEKIYLAEEIKTMNSQLVTELLQKIFVNSDLEIIYLKHEKLKKLSLECKVIVRTGEFSPFANIILQSGVGF